MLLSTLALLPLMAAPACQCEGAPSPALPAPPVPAAPNLPAPRGPGAPPSTPSSPASPPASPGPIGPSSPGAGPVGPTPTPRPGSGAAAAASLDDDWRTWWKWNREAFLEHDYHAGPVTGDQSGGSRAVGQDLVARVITPALIAEMERATPGREIHGAVLLALGRAIDPSDTGAAATLARLESSLSNDSHWISENATLALGLTGQAASARHLGQMFAEDDAGRALLGGKHLSNRGRAFTACALALVACDTQNPDVRRFALSELTRRVAPEKGEPTAGLSAVLGLAVAAEARPGIANELTSLVDAARSWAMNEDLDHRVRAHVPRLLAALAADAPALVAEGIVQELLAAHATKPRGEIRSGLVQALGRVPIANEKLAAEVVDRLLAAAEKGQPFEKRMALLALGRRAPHPGGSAAVKYLTRSSKRPTGWVEPWVALAFGLWGHEELNHGATPDPERLRTLRISLRRARNPENAAAWGLALGLSRDVDAVDALLDRLESAPTGPERGLFALALGMTRSPAAIEPLRALTTEVEHDAAVLEDCVIARSMAGDPELSRSLLAGLEGACCVHSAGAHARAIGRVRDARLVGPLVATLERPQRRTLERAWAASALGRLADASPAPWASRFSIGLNYHAVVGALTSSDGSGLLDLN